MKCTTPHAWCNDSFRAYHFLSSSLAFCRSADRGKILFRRILLQCSKCFLTLELGSINPIKITLKEEVSYNCIWCKHGKENLVKKKLGKLLSKNYLWNIILKYGERYISTPPPTTNNYLICISVDHLVQRGQFSKETRLV